MACDCHPQTDLCDSCTELLATGAEQERERIIALIETEMCEAYGENCDDNPHCTARNRVIALIKGENE